MNDGCGAPLWYHEARQPYFCGKHRGNTRLISVLLLEIQMTKITSVDVTDYCKIICFKDQFF